MSIEVITTNKGPDLFITINGYLDENATLPNFDEEIKGKLVINLGGLTMINSLGSRRWLKWIKSIHAAGGVVLTNCSAPFITQVNVLHNFLPSHVRVESLQLPYVCTQCSNEMSVVYPVTSYPHVEENRSCSSCGADSEIDVVLSKHFNFLKTKVG